MYTIFHQNVQSLKNKILEVELCIRNINPTPLFICLTEHWYTEPEKCLMKLETYTMKSAWCRRNMIHGGSCIFVKDDLETEELNDIKHKSVEGHLECSSVVCRPIKTVIVCIYRPPTGILDTFFETLGDILDTCQNNFKKYKIILCGDFNINLKNVNNITKTFQNLLMTYNLIQFSHQAELQKILCHY